MLLERDIDSFLQTISGHGVDLITLHWTVGTYNQIFNDDYHFQIRGDGSIHVDARAFDNNGFFVPLAHAWHHNTDNIGIALCGMYNAKAQTYSVDLVHWPSEYGDYPPTKEQIDTLIKLTAKLVDHFGLTINQIKTHYDLAQEDGYPGERWEFKYEKPLLIQKIQEELNATKST